VDKGFPRIKTFHPRSAWIAKSTPLAYQVSGKPLDLAIQREQVEGLFSWNPLTGRFRTGVLRADRQIRDRVKFCDLPFAIFNRRF